MQNSSSISTRRSRGTGPWSRSGLAALLAALLALGIVISSPASADDGPAVSLGDASGLERDDVIGSIFLPVTLSAAATAPVVVSYYTVNDTAVYIPPEDRVDVNLFGDYQRRGTVAEPRTVTIPAGAVQTTINVAVNIDDEVEPDETFSVVIASVSGGGAVVGDDTGTATIVDADGVSSVNPAITVSNGSIHEGDSGQRMAQFFVHLSRAPATNVSIAYASSNGTAQSPGDYIAKLPGTVTFAPGQISKTIDVRVNSDTVVGQDVGFTLTVDLTGGSPVEEISMVGTSTILDDDQVAPPTIQAGLAGGNNHTCALSSAGTVECWGDNAQGQLGDGTTTPSLTAVPVAALGSVADVVAGDSHTCALTTAGGVKCWGNNLNGQLGDGTSTQRELPTDVTGLSSGVVAIGAGDNHTCAALAAGGIKCWGWGTSGQLGHGLIGSSSVPVDVQGLPAGTSAVEISAGYRHTCAALTDGSASCWGRGTEGQLGNGTSPARQLVAVQPTGLGSNVTAIVGGGTHTCAVQGGAVKCFGLNGSGQLGNGTSGATAGSNVPVTVTGLSGIDRVAGGGTHSCSLSAAGQAQCWGLNQEGQLGISDPQTNNVATPLPVTPLATGQIDLSAGVQHTCAMASDESVRCWGLNTAGQLGNGNTTRQYAPVSVIGLWN